MLSFVRRYWQFLSAFVLPVLLFTQLAQAANQSFVIGSLKTPQTLYPLKQKAGENDFLRNFINPPILWVRHDGRLICILCKDNLEIETIKDSSGTVTGYALSLELKNKIQWSDGKTLSPQDIKYTLETMAMTEYGTDSAPLLPIKQIEIDRQIKSKMKIYLTHRRSDAFQMLAISVLPSHKADLIERLKKNPLDPEALKDPGLYYGAYVVKSADAKRWQLSKNRNSFFEGAPSQDLEFRFYDSDQAMIPDLRSQEIDQLAEEQFEFQDIVRLEKDAPDIFAKYDLKSRVSEKVEILVFNMNSPYLVNPLLRQLLFHAINRQPMQQQILKGHGEAAKSFLNSWQLERLGEDLPDAYQPPKVQKILEQLNAKKGSDGILIVDGQRISIELACSDSRLVSGVFQSAIRDMQAIGVEIKLVSYAEADFKQNILKKRKFRDMACARWHIPHLSIPLTLMHSLAIPSSENRYFGDNLSAWNLPVVDRILENMQRDAESQQMLRLMLRLDKQFLSELPAAPLVFWPQYWLTKKKFQAKDHEETASQLANYPVNREPQARKKM